jgi:hypothetical protein
VEFRRLRTGIMKAMKIFGFPEKIIKLLEEKLKYSEENLSQCQSVHHKSHMD